MCAVARSSFALEFVFLFSVTTECAVSIYRGEDSLRVTCVYEICEVCTLVHFVCTGILLLLCSCAGFCVVFIYWSLGSSRASLGM